jgi:hypothetical protein
LEGGLIAWGALEKFWRHQLGKMDFLINFAVATSFSVQKAKILS